MGATHARSRASEGSTRTEHGRCHVSGGRLDRRKRERRIATRSHQARPRPLTSVRFRLFPSMIRASARPNGRRTRCSNSGPPGRALYPCSATGPTPSPRCRRALVVPRRAVAVRRRVGPGPVPSCLAQASRWTTRRARSWSSASTSISVVCACTPEVQRLAWRARSAPCLHGRQRRGLRRRPGTRPRRTGRLLLAHELTHVTQNSASSGHVVRRQPQPARKWSDIWLEFDWLGRPIPTSPRHWRKSSLSLRQRAPTCWITAWKSSSGWTPTLRADGASSSGRRATTLQRGDTRREVWTFLGSHDGAEVPTPEYGP